MQNVVQSYEAALAERGYTADAAQFKAISELQRLADELAAYQSTVNSSGHGFFKKMFNSKKVEEAPKGVYFWGGVGRGKSFLMDCFYEEVPMKNKIRIHFHEFMRSFHHEMHKLRHKDNPLDEVAKATAQKYQLICFDEFHVSDIADAMILYRLLSQMMAQGVVFVMTSNYEPSTLYPDGLQRERLIPAINLIEEQMIVINVDTGIDYRRRTLEQVKLYYSPLNSEVQQQMQKLYRTLSDSQIQASTVEVEDRQIPVVAKSSSVVWFDFESLCESARSQNDYLELAGRYKTIFLSNVPKMNHYMAQAARRFTWLIDVLYDFKVKLIMSAECPAEELYTEGVLANEFTRTVSRIVEMQSKEYLAQERRESVQL